MARNITVTLKDGSQIRYDGVPDTVTPAEVQSRAEKESGLAVVEIDGGSPTKEAPAQAPKEESFLSKLFGDFSKANQLVNENQSDLSRGMQEFSGGVSKALVRPVVGAAQLGMEGAKLAGVDLGDSNKMVAAAEKGLTSAFGETEGYAGQAGEIGGAIINPVNKLFGLPAKTLGGAAVKGAAAGMTQAALNPTQTEDYWVNKAKDVAIGGATGLTLGAAFGKQVSQTRDIVDETFSKSNNLFEAVKGAGLKLRPATAQKMTKSIAARIDEEIPSGLKGRDMAKVRDLIRKFRIDNGKADGGLESFERLRRKAAKLVANAGDNADQREAAYIIRAAVDDVFSNVDKKMIKAGDSAAVEKLLDARGLYRSASRANILQKVLDDAKDAAGTVRGLSYPDALAQKLTKLATSKNLQYNFTPEEIKMLKKLSKGGGFERTTELLGKLSSLPSMVASGAGALPSGGWSLAVPAGAAVLKEGTKRITSNLREEGVEKMIGGMLAP